MMSYNKILLSALLLFFMAFLMPQKADGTHLMGGSLTYEYLDNNGSFSEPYRYKVKIQMFRDCYNSTTPFDGLIEVGIYYNNFSRTRYKTERISPYFRGVC
jgi:hypothetical protein